MKKTTTNDIIENKHQICIEKDREQNTKLTHAELIRWLSMEIKWNKTNFVVCLWYGNQWTNETTTTWNYDQQWLLEVMESMETEKEEEESEKKITNSHLTIHSNIQNTYVKLLTVIIFVYFFSHHISFRCVILLFFCQILFTSLFLEQKEFNTTYKLKSMKKTTSFKWKKESEKQ